jgi:calcineurin-like phosphoesterase family protein
MSIFLISDNHFDAYPYLYKVFPRNELCKYDNTLLENRLKNNDLINKEMINGWNSVVSDDDLVISIGDFCYTDPRPWLDKLNGNKIMLRGNHDNWCEGYAGDWHMILEYKKMRFYVTHDPAYVPRDWKEWVIHGHHHNMPGFPFINGDRKNINVACELVDYTPVDIDWILSFDIDSIVRMDTVNDNPVLMT